MPRCVFLTFDHRDGHVIDDDLAVPHLGALGWDVEQIPWRRPDVPWEAFDGVIIRTPWDYWHHLAEFLATLAEIERRTQLHNPLDLVRWNLRKTYLRDLAARGVPIVPTLWRDGLRDGELGPLFAALAAPAGVIKPVVSANADGAWRLDADVVRTRAPEIEAYYADRALMLQPFVPSVTEEGEWSLLFFDGVHSHTILKTPKSGDFRVQEDHGGRIRPAEAEPSLRAAAARVMAALGPTPLYARTDFVRAPDGSWWLMEVEVTEPSLYLRMDPEAPARFARAIDARLRR